MHHVGKALFHQCVCPDPWTKWATGRKAVCWSKYLEKYLSHCSHWVCLGPASKLLDTLRARVGEAEQICHSSLQVCPQGKVSHAGFRRFLLTWFLLSPFWALFLVIQSTKFPRWVSAPFPSAGTLSFSFSFKIILGAIASRKTSGSPF